MQTHEHPPQLDGDAAYSVLQARDARFDGRLFVGVTSTGIYCRPVCRVRLPMQKNCRFFGTRAQAEAAAFRPCMKCRPEIAPGWSVMDSSNSLALEAARRLEHAAHSGQAVQLPALAQRLGVTDRHLRRIFIAAHGVGPLSFLTTQRLLLAKQLLTDTQLPVTEVALACGFDSLRRFNAAFVERYRFNPTQLRKQNGSVLAKTGSEDLGQPTLRLAYRPPYDVQAVLQFFATRQVQGLEEVDATSLRRTLGLWHQGQRITGWLSLQFVPTCNEVHVHTSSSLTPILGTVLAQVRQALDLDADPSRIDPTMALLPVPLRPGTRVPGMLCGFENAVRIILGQQVTVKAARTLVQRLVDRFGERVSTPISTPFAKLTHVFPSAQTLASASAQDIGTLGIVRQRVGALQALAHAVAQGHIELHPHAPLQATLDALRALPGVGEWTAQVIAMRALAWPDAWPSTDVALMNALGTRSPAQVAALAEPWRPWRAYAVMRLWHHIEHGSAPAGASDSTHWCVRQHPLVRKTAPAGAPDN
jgi:AraC family transcriptional regulator, regulatory protein of adaptative response / DNA-3-methyladenine glycosylase II